MSVAKEFGKRLAQLRREKAARERRDILQKDVAKAIGTSAASVNRWEAGDVLPKDAALAKLANYFGVGLGWLRYGEPSATASAPASDAHLRKSERELAELILKGPAPKAKPVQATGTKRSRR